MKSYQLHFSEALGDENSDASLELSTTNDGVVAHAALWWRDTPLLDGAKIGAIGDFSANDAEAAGCLLDAAANYLRERDCRTAVGPLNGNTWQAYRFVVESKVRGPFLLEPRNPAEFPEWWEDAGLSVLSRYSSSVMPLDQSEVVPPALKVRLARTGITLRKLDISRYDDELRKIFAISIKSFTHNFLYTPLEETAFLAAYQKVRDHVDADLVWIAERDGVPCGFVFGIPDLEALARGEKPAVIVKTLAVDPEARCAGLGSLLVGELHRTSWEKGYTEAIHALQHETNTSLKITGRHRGEVFRRYALFAKLL